MNAQPTQEPNGTSNGATSGRQKDAASAPRRETTNQTAPERAIFVFYEGKTQFRRTVDQTLHAWGLIPIDLDGAFEETMELAQWLNRYPDSMHAVALLSGECFVYPRDGKPVQAHLTSTIRHTYLLGYLMARYGKNRVTGLVKAQSTYRLPVPQYEGVFIPVDAAGSWKEILKNRLMKGGLIIE